MNCNNNENRDDNTFETKYKENADMGETKT
jgi:hypothetical protein